METAYFVGDNPITAMPEVIADGYMNSGSEILSAFRDRLKELYDTVGVKDAKYKGNLTMLMNTAYRDVHKLVLESYAKEVQAIREEYQKLQATERRLNEYECRIAFLKSEAKELERDITKNQEMAEKYPDAKFRQALQLMEDVGLTIDKHDSEYLKQKKATASGAIISAALGMTCYFGKSTTKDTDTTE